jgi:PIN domain nuclease of toxin-antitoxin system
MVRHLEGGAVVLLDTHCAVFLHAGETELFGSTARHLLDAEDLYISPMVLLELQYLYETGKIAFDGQTILDELQGDLGLRVLDRHWYGVCAKAMELSWTRDPFDRTITAQALVEGQRLLTRNRMIREHCSLAFWD